MSEDVESLRRKELEIQKKQLTAQRITAAASAANALAAAHQAATMSQIREDFNEAAAATAKHQREMAETQQEIAEQQRLMAEEQKLTNFRNTILGTLPLLKEEEKNQFLSENLRHRITLDALAFNHNPIPKRVLEASKFSEFAQEYCDKNEKVAQIMVTGKALHQEREFITKVSTEIEEGIASFRDKQAMQEAEQEKLEKLDKQLTVIVPILAAVLVGLTFAALAYIACSILIHTM